MKKLLINQILMIFSLCGLLACATTQEGFDEAPAERSSRGTDCISQSSIRDYYVLDDANLVVTGVGKRVYHVSLVRRAFGLTGSWRLGFRSRTGMVCPGSDELVVDDGLDIERINIRSIRRLTPEQHEDLLVRFGKKQPEAEQTPEPEQVEGAEVEELD